MDDLLGKVREKKILQNLPNITGKFINAEKLQAFILYFQNNVHV